MRYRQTVFDRDARLLRQFYFYGTCVKVVHCCRITIVGSALLFTSPSHFTHIKHNISYSPSDVGSGLSSCPHAVFFGEVGFFVASGTRLAFPKLST